MATIQITIPDAFITLYNQRRTTYNVFANANGLPPLPPATAAIAQRFILDFMKGVMLRESARIDPGDGSVWAADLAAIQNV